MGKFFAPAKDGENLLLVLFKVIAACYLYRVGTEGRSPTVAMGNLLLNIRNKGQPSCLLAKNSVRDL